MIALTSLSPAPAREAAQAACLESWRAAGLKVRSVNPHAEIGAVRARYAADFVAVVAPTVRNRTLVCLDTMLAEVRELDEPVLLVNADFELALSAAQLARFVEAARPGLGYLMQRNHDGDRAVSEVETQGFGAFLVRPEHAAFVMPSVLRFGEPWWDYLLPWHVLRNDQHLYAPPAPAGYHLRHGGRWTAECWYACAQEFARAAGLPLIEEDDDPQEYGLMAQHVLAMITKHTITAEVGA